MSISYLLTANGLSLFQPRFDSTIRMAKELLKRGFPTFYLDTDALPTAELKPNLLNALPVQEILEADPLKKEFFKLSPLQKKPVTDFHVLIHRRDPPVDETFRAFNDFFLNVPDLILQINNPEWTSKLSEHELPMEFPQFSTPTFICAHFEDFQKKVRELEPETVAKPRHQSSGVGIQFFKKTTPEVELKRYWSQWTPSQNGTIVVQPFIKEIETLGDLRIVTVNQKILGSVTRVPKKGSRLGNLHAGATPQKLNPTQNQIEASLYVAKVLAKKGIHLLGLDFIGPYLNEINITSPSAIVQINEVMGFDHFPKLIDEFEDLRRNHQK
jgi:glutathione synthase